MPLSPANHNIQNYALTLPNQDSKKNWLGEHINPFNISKTGYRVFKAVCSYAVVLRSKLSFDKKYVSSAIKISFSHYFKNKY